MKRPDVTQRVYVCAPAAFRARRAGGAGEKILMAAPGGWARRRRLAENRQTTPGVSAGMKVSAVLPALRATFSIDMAALAPVMQQCARAYRNPIIAGLAASTAAAVLGLSMWHAPPGALVPALAPNAAKPLHAAAPVHSSVLFADVRGSAVMTSLRVAAAGARPRPMPATALGLSDDGTIVVVAEPRVGRADGFDLDITSPGSLWAKTGARYRIDPVLIYAVALVETRGLQPDGSVAPSPWIVRINGHLHSGTRKETEHAIELANLLAVPVQDVGIMQVYYPVHRDIEPDPIALLNPARNIEIGTRLLHQAMRESTDPVLRIGYYHSHDATLARGYGELVLNVYRELKTAMGKSPARAVAWAANGNGAAHPGGS